LRHPHTDSENIEAAPSDLIRVAKESGFEGIVAKRMDSVYEPGKRTGAWVKYRVRTLIFLADINGKELSLAGALN